LSDRSASDRRRALPAPDIVEVILGGWADLRVRLERPLPVGWEEQRHRFMVREGTAAASPCYLTSTRR
jgi:hypothetical protein